MFSVSRFVNRWTLQISVLAPKWNLVAMPKRKVGPLQELNYVVLALTWIVVWIAGILKFCMHNIQAEAEGEGTEQQDSAKSEPAPEVRKTIWIKC